MKNVILAFAIAGAITGCATKSDKIAAAYVPASRFEAMSCEQLYVEGQQMNRTLATMSSAQDKKASGDAALVGVGLILFWPALLATSGTLGADGNEAQIAQMKGDAQAMDAAYRMKGCGVKPSV